MKSRHLILILGLAATSAYGWASGAQIQLLPQTSVSVADQRSTITINATIFTSGGGLAPDGTQVVFSASNGSFRDQIVTTTQGRAQAILVAPATPGTCIVTATAPAYGAVSTTDIEFFSDRSLLNSAKEYIEVYAPNKLAYGSQSKMMTASATDQGVHLRYREIAIDADDLQLSVPSYEVRAKHAHVKMGKFDFETTDLYLKLNSRQGYAYGHYKGPTVVGLKPFGPWMKPIMEERDHFGFASLEPSGLKPAVAGMTEEQAFTFNSVSAEETTIIQARKAIAFPRKEVQFQDAEILVGGAKAMKLPLYRDSMTSGGDATQQIVTVNDNHLTVNYPYYLTLGPGQSSILRFRTGQSYGRGIGASNRVSLDYELNWNKGDDMDGGFIFSGLARKDWDVSLRQYLRFKDDTTLYFNADMPSSKALFGSATLNKQFKGFGVSLSALENHAFSGPKFDTQSLTLSAESNPIKAGKLPLRTFFGLAANTQTTSNALTGSLSQHGAGLTARAQLLQQTLDRNSTFNAGFRFVQNFTGTEQRSVMNGNATLTRAINPNFNVLLSYEYNNDGFSKLLGEHTLNLNANYDLGNFHFSGYALRGLDAQRMTYFFDASYHFSSRWYLMYSHTFTEFLGERSLQYYPTLAYNLGGRLIGLTWSNNTKRFGIQLLGAPFN